MIVLIKFLEKNIIAFIKDVSLQTY